MDLILTTDIKKGLQIVKRTPGAVLIDVREKDEYAEGHIPGSVNIPLNDLENDIYDHAPDTDAPLFLYCLSGSRSIQGAYILKEFGYDNACSIGGIENYTGDLLTGN